MKYTRLGSDKYLKFEAGKVIEGIYQGYTQRDNSFEGAETEFIYDYTITIEDKDKVLSSTSEALEQLIPLAKGTPIKIEMVQHGIRKGYRLYVGEPE